MKHRHFDFHSRRHWRAAGRHGIALFIVLFAMFAAGAVLLTLSSAAATRLADIRDNRHRLQTDQLADAGVQRAIAQLRASGEYRGETWRVPADELGSDWPAEVKIEVTAPDESDKDKLQVSVQADYPPDEMYRTRRSRELLVSIKSQGTTP
jgi:membrane protein implicated in regulation of membrane protease activity